MCNEVLTRLRDDHGRFERLFVEIENQCAATENGAPVNATYLSAIVAYLREYALRLHHALEDAIFAKLLEKQPHFLEIYDLAEDHRACRREFEAFALAAIPVDDNFTDLARSYVGNERAHFIAEEEVFFPYAQRLLLDEQWQALQASLADDTGNASNKYPAIAHILGVV